MLSIPQDRLRAAKFNVLGLLLAVAAGGLTGCSGCFGESSAASQTQRRIGEARLRDGLTVSATFGTVRGFDEDELVLRQASPTARVSVETGPDTEGSVDFVLRNVHREALLRILSVDFRDSETASGCPLAAEAPINCIAAAADVDSPCDTSGQCESGLRCAEGTCQPDSAFEACTAPETTRLTGQATSMTFDLDIASCRVVQLETYVPDDGGPVTFAVVGPTRSAEVLEGLGDALTDEAVDFVAILGDNAPGFSVDALDELERTTVGFGVPVVALAGGREISADRGAAFLRRFGPHDHVWGLKGVQFFVFYSALRALGPRGFDRLETFLAQITSPGGEGSPVIGLTHTPPLDPEGLADNGFLSDVEGARVLSLLQEYGVSRLYAGGLRASETEVHDMGLFVTSAATTLTNKEREWILVTVSARDEGGERNVSHERIAFESE